MPPQQKAQPRRLGAKKNGLATLISSTFNNTIVSITDRPVQLLPGHPAQVGFGDRKSTPYAPRSSREVAASRDGTRHAQVDVFMGSRLRPRRPIRSLEATGLEVGAISDVTPVAHNGCRPPKRRRSETEGDGKMARYTGPDCKRCRRKDQALRQRAKCETAKCPIEKRPVPGDHGRALAPEQVPVADATKQNCARIYGVREAVPQLLRRANRQSGKTGENLLTILESRPDNVVFRAGFGKAAIWLANLFVGHISRERQEGGHSSYRVT